MNTMEFKDILFTFFSLLLVACQIIASYFFAATSLKKRKSFLVKNIVFFSALLLVIALFSYLLSAFSIQIGTILQPIYEAVIFLSIFFFLQTIYVISYQNVLFISFMPLISRLLIREIMSVMIHNHFLMEYSLWIEIIVSLLVLTAFYHLLIRPYKDDLELYSVREMNYFCILLFVMNIVLFVFEKIVASLDSMYVIILSFFEFAYSLCIMILYYSLIKQNQSINDLAVLKKLWDKDRLRYEAQKESGELIQIRYHDLKHQIQNMKGQNDITEQMMEELEKNVDIYNSVFKTENQVVDVILSNFYLRCLNSNVVLTSVVDGKCLCFMDDLDIYSLLANLLDNALEYEEKVLPKENRFISLNIRSSSNKITIHVENYCIEDLHFEKVSTTKVDKENHGFGLKSVKKITEKYKGYFKMFHEDDMVQVDIIFPKGENL